ncbi:MAG: hypothetical protein EPO40_01700 [Myxococcaceae bacterium]|nr:MAG: hypothetical protein EPO40_01700 [Myxococcaceae bacterium]
MTRLSRVLERIEQGWSPQCLSRPAEGEEWGVIKLSAIRAGCFDHAENKALPEHEAPATPLEIRSGDLLVTRANTRERVGDVCRVKVVRPHLMISDLVFRLHCTESVCVPEYLAMVLLSSIGRTQCRADAQGSNATMVKISQRTIYSWHMPLPPLAEQRSIARFLDRSIATIDSAVAEHERNLDLLAERRRTLTSDAVTRGLDPAAPMRESGVSWIGLIPVTWNVIDLRRLVDPSRPITYGIVLPGENVADGVPIVKSGDCTQERLTPERLHRTTRAIEASYGRSRLKGGDLVISIRGTVGLVAQVPPSLEGANLTQDAARIAPTAKTDTGWLLHVLRSTPIQIEIAHRTVGATVRGLNLRELRRLVLPVPPKAEQRRIAAFLDEHAAPIDAAAEKTRRAIELLHEYRQSLITAAVTGRLRPEETH